MALLPSCRKRNGIPLDKSLNISKGSTYIGSGTLGHTDGTDLNVCNAKLIPTAIDEGSYFVIFAAGRLIRGHTGVFHARDTFAAILGDNRCAYVLNCFGYLRCRYTDCWRIAAHGAVSAFFHFAKRLAL